MAIVQPRIPPILTARIRERKMFPAAGHVRNRPRMSLQRRPKASDLLLRLLRKAFYFGRRRYCVVCKSSLRVFNPFGQVRRPDAQCGVCRSVERHRLTWLFFEQRTDLFDRKPKRVLHVAPEAQLERNLRQLEGVDYVCTDVDAGCGELVMDIMALSFADDSMDVILCSHVLEHVADDRKAMRELARVLSPKGWATILVPIIADASWEDATVTSHEDRSRLFGQWDHVRAYGPDFKQRLEQEGFEVERITAAELLDRGNTADTARFQIKDEELFFCRKRPSLA
jgi:SAM-dependent methyltransferase